MSWRGFFISLGVALAVAVFGNLPLMGIPGALVMGVFGPFADVFYGSGFYEGRDFAAAAWPAAILLTLLWPLAVPLGYLAGWGLLRGSARWARWAAMAGVLLVWGFALTVVMVGQMPKA